MRPRGLGVPRCLLPNRRGGSLRRRQRHPRAAGLGEPDRDNLFRGACAVLAVADVVDLLTHELASLRARRLALPLVLRGTLTGLLVRHVVVLPWLARHSTPLHAWNMPTPSMVFMGGSLARHGLRGMHGAWHFATGDSAGSRVEDTVLRRSIAPPRSPRAAPHP